MKQDNIRVPIQKASQKSEKSKHKRGGQIGHKGHQQKLMEPATQDILFPDRCDCGCSSFDPESIKPFYTHQVIELPKIEMDVRHFILNQGVCIQCGNSERKDPTTSRFGELITKDLQLLCHWAKVFPDDQEWRDFYQRFTDLIFDHQEHKGEVGTLARSLIRQIESLWVFLDIEKIEPTNNLAERILRHGVLWRKRSKGTQSEKGNRWVERILSFKQT